ncbi:TonB-dependent siderophore receptor [Gloeocapsa sp. BRSZ]
MVSVRYGRLHFRLLILPSWTLMQLAIAVLFTSVAWAESLQETQIPRKSEIEQVAQSAELLVQSPTPSLSPASVVAITEVQANPTEQGVEVILATSQGEQLQIINRSVGSNYIADIPNAQLRLASGDAIAFRSEKPVEGITEITVTNVDTNTIRLTVVGETELPTVELFDSNEGLIFALTPAAAATSETPPEDPAAQGDDLIELLVTGQQDDGYNPSNATAGTRTNTPIRDVPQSIQVVPRQVIEDQGATSVTEALRNVPGVVPASPARRQFTLPIIRGFGGFGSDNLVRRNGLRDTLATSDAGETASVERIEVLRGPASVLYGQGSLGGIVNIITKEPLSQPFYEIEASVGSYNFYRGTVDLSGPINDTGSLLYRLNIAAETSGSFRDFYDRDRYLIAPVLSWYVGENTTLTIEGEYLDLQQPEDFGLPASGTVLANPNGDISRDRYIGEPSIEGQGRSIEFYRIGYNLEHQFSQNWQLRNAFGAVFRRENGFSVFPSSLSSDGRTLAREYFDAGNGFANNAYTLDTYVVGNFNTGSVNHNLVAGIELSKDEQINSNASFGMLSSIDLFNPQYGNTTINPPDGRIDDKETKEGLGIYIQDQISFSSNLILVLGGRFDIVNVTNEDFLSSTTSFQQNEAFSPRIGIVYKPVTNISLYGSYSRSFQQEIGRTFDNSIFEPQRGIQYEIGVKTDFDDRLSATLALYDLTRSNVVTEDPDNPGFSIQTGEQNSQGVELNLAGEILPGWNIVAGYAYNNARITEDNTLTEGNRLNNAPENAFSLWTTYRIQSGSMQGLGFGLGFFYVGEREGDLANTFTVPSYFRTDAALFYEQNNFRAALNIRNLFDIDYFESAQNALRVFQGDPLTVVGSVSWEF